MLSEKESTVVIIIDNSASMAVTKDRTSFLDQVKLELPNIVSSFDGLVDLQVYQTTPVRQLYKGIFEKGDHILIKDQNNFECARGLTSFSSLEIEKIKGSHSREIKNILGYSSREEIIHKDDLVKV